LASTQRGSTPDGSKNDIDYCHQGWCIVLVSDDYFHNAKKIRFNGNLIDNRNDPNLHQVLARAFHPYYVTKDENFSTNDCIGGWRVCSPPAVYDMAVRKITSCEGMPFDCDANRGILTFQMLHTYLWANQVSGSADHCGDAEGNIVVIRVDPEWPTVAYVWYVKGRDDDWTVHAIDLDFTGATRSSRTTAAAAPGAAAVARTINSMPGGPAMSTRITGPWITPSSSSTRGWSTTTSATRSRRSPV
jgi:hypothetical protein